MDKSKESGPIIIVSPQAALAEMLQELNFVVILEKRVTVAETGAVHTSELWYNKKFNLGVELHPEHSKVVVTACRQNNNGAIEQNPICMPCRLFWNKPAILRAFLEETVNPSQAHKTITGLPEA